MPFRGLAIALAALLALPALALAQDVVQEPSEDMRNAAVATSATFWAVVDSPSRAAAYELLTPELKAEVTKEKFLQILEDIDRMSGGTEDRRMSRITWYERPSASGGMDFYAAVDFQADGPKARLYCGYAIVHFPGGEPGGIMRFEQNVVDNGAAEGMTDERLALYAKAFRC